jgi:hypothetical protein
VSLKGRIDANEYAKLRDDLVSEYVSDGGESYVLQIEGRDGQLEPPPENVGPLKSAFEKLKVERDRTKEELAARRSDRPDDATRELLETRLAETERRLAQIPIDGQAKTDAMNAEYEPKIAEADAKLKAARSDYDKIFLDHGLHSVIRGAGGAPELLQGKLEKFCRVEHDSETDEARIVVVDEDGIRRDDPVTGQPISAAHALEELRLFDPQLEAAFTNGNGHGGLPH